MVLRLVLTRHAKSDWTNANLADHDRPLNGRGQRSATAMASWLLEAGHTPELALVSPAARAQQTWNRMRAVFGSAPEIRAIPELYLATAEEILREIKRGAKASPLMLIGHNPGLAELAGALAHGPPDHVDAARFPTCATLILDFSISDWSDVNIGRGDVVTFQTPKLLTK